MNGSAGAPSPVWLSGHSTLIVGGPAKRFISVHDVPALRKAVAAARQSQERVFILGGGSNVVFDDDGFDGWVIQPTMDRLAFEELGSGRVRVRAGAGLRWDDLVQAAVERELAGVEAMSGIPGHVGAAPIQNIGAYGQELAESVETVGVYDFESGERRVFKAQECAFAYRQSRFKSFKIGTFAITDITLILTRSVGPIPLGYADLQRHFDGDTAPSPADVRSAVLSIRKHKAMVFDPDVPDSHSAGSFFTNPVVDPPRFEAVRARAQAQGHSRVPHYVLTDGRIKIPAAWLIENAGIERGLLYAGARISTRHVLAITNPGGATAAGVRALAAHVQNAVQTAWDLRLQPEARILTTSGINHHFYGV